MDTACWIMLWIVIFGIAYGASDDYYDY